MLQSNSSSRGSKSSTKTMKSLRDDHQPILHTKYLGSRTIAIRHTLQHECLRTQTSGIQASIVLSKLRPNSTPILMSNTSCLFWLSLSRSVSPYILSRKLQKQAYLRRSSSIVRPDDNSEERFNTGSSFWFPHSGHCKQESRNMMNRTSSLYCPRSVSL